MSSVLTFDEGAVGVDFNSGRFGNCTFNAYVVGFPLRVFYKVDTAIRWVNKTNKPRILYRGLREFGNRVHVDSFQLVVYMNRDKKAWKAAWEAGVAWTEAWEEEWEERQVWGAT